MLPWMAGKAPRASARSTLVCMAVVAHEFHHLGGKFLAFGRAVADAGVVHQVGQAHDAQADAAGAVGGFFELRHRRDVGVGFDHVIQEDGGEHHALAQLFPIDGAVRAEVLGQVDRAQAAVFVGAKPLLAARVGGFELRRGAGPGWSGWRRPGRARPARRCGAPGVTILSNRSRARTVL